MEDKTALIQHGVPISLPSTQEASALPFQQHPQFSIMVDVLIRKHCHHLILQSRFSSLMYHAFLQAFLQHLGEEHISYPIRHANLYYFDLETLSQSKTSQQALENELTILLEKLEQAEQHLILALRLGNNDHLVQKTIKPFLHHARCRIIALTTQEKPFQLEQQFTLLQIQAPQHCDRITLIKQQSQELETFHHVIIPEETLLQAFVLAERYLNASETIENTLLLLDSSAARASVEHIDHHNPFKPIVTPSILLQVLSAWTRIPAAYLPLAHFQAGEFSHALQQRLFGQDRALRCISQHLQRSHAGIQDKAGPFACFLFAGAPYTGKKTAAMLICKSLFSHLDALFVTQLSATSAPLTEIKLQRHSDKQHLSLKQIICQTPYAVLFFQDIDQASPETLNAIAEIASTGCLYDNKGQQYHFQQAIILLSTTLGANYLAAMTKNAVEDDTQQLDLMQLILQQQKQAEKNQAPDYSSEALIETILPSLSEKLPALLLQNANIIPFLPLDRDSIEKIIRLKFKKLGQQLKQRHEIDLGYAPEVIRFLADEALKYSDAKQPRNPIEDALKQLYVSIEQTILTQEERANRPQQLFLQLNETGQVLRCHWLALPVARQHA